MYEKDKEYEDQKQKVFENAKKVLEVFKKYEEKTEEEDQEER